VTLIAMVMLIGFLITNAAYLVQVLPELFR